MAETEFEFGDRKIPWWAIGLAGGVVLFVLVTVLRRTAPTGQAPESAATQGWLVEQMTAMQNKFLSEEESLGKSIQGVADELVKAQQENAQQVAALQSQFAAQISDITKAMTGEIGDVLNQLGQMQQTSEKRFESIETTIADLIKGLNQNKLAGIQPVSGYKELLTLWQRAQSELVLAGGSSWRGAGLSRILAEISSNPTVFVGEHPVRTQLPQLAESTPGWQQIEQAYEEAKKQLGAQHPYWYGAGIMEVINELRKHPELMQGQAARTILVNQPV